MRQLLWSHTCPLTDAAVIWSQSDQIDPSTSRPSQSSSGFRILWKHRGTRHAPPHYNSECHHLLRPLYRVDSLDSDGSLLNQSCILAYNLQLSISQASQWARTGPRPEYGAESGKLDGSSPAARRQPARSAQCHVSPHSAAVTCGIFGRCTQRFLLDLIQTWPSSPHPCFVQATTTTIEAATESLGAGSYHDYEDIDWYFPTLPDIQLSNNECSIFRIVKSSFQ